MSRYFFISFVLISLGLYQVSPAQDTTQKIIPNRQNAPVQQEKPYVILISVDGFRYDYIQKYQAKHLQELAAQGVKAEAMLPSFPSITFPNHYSIVTGMYPSHHGLVGNNIYDPKTNTRYSMSNAKAVKDPRWYGGIPIWTLAEQQQLLSASFYWPGSEAPIGGQLPTYYYAYNEKIPISNRIQTVVNWLSLPKEKRPHIISFYFPEVDHAGHRYGPDAPQTEQAVHFIDSAVYALYEAVKTTQVNVNFILVSDHGMTDINRDEALALPIRVDTTQMQIASNGTIVSIHIKDPKQIDSLYREIQKKADHFDAFLKSNVPKALHYGTKDDYFGRIGDIILSAKAPYYFSNNRPNPGAHGYDPRTVKDMQATFLAWGPNFKQGLILPTFENVHVYPLLALLLDLSYDHKIDGKPDVLKKIVVGY